MTHAEFCKVTGAQLEYCVKLLTNKGDEYSSDADRLGHFKKAAAINNSTPKAALLGMLTKHLVSVSDMCTDGKVYSKERWEEKITDSINYLLLLRALVEEEKEELLTPEIPIPEALKNEKN